MPDALGPAKSEELNLKLARYVRLLTLAENIHAGQDNRGRLIYLNQTVSKRWPRRGRAIAAISLSEVEIPVAAYLVSSSGSLLLTPKSANSPSDAMPLPTSDE